MIHYIDVVSAARETVGKMLVQRTGMFGYSVHVTTNGGRTAGAHRNGTMCIMDLPSLAPDTVLTRGEADRMVAYLVHEVCHMLHTDFSVWADAVAQGHRVQHWTNALEDIRIEAHEMRVGPYKAMRGLLSGLVSHLYAEARTGLDEQGKSLGHSMLNAPYMATVLGREANGYDLPTVRTLKSELSPNVRNVMTVALAGVKACKSTRDCLELALELVALEKTLKAQEPQPQPQQPKQPKQPQQPGGEGQGQGAGAGDDCEDGEGDDQMRQGDTEQGEQGESEKPEPSAKPENNGPCDAQEPDQGEAEEDEGDQGGHGEGEESGKEPENDQPGAKGDQANGDGAGGGDAEDEDEGKAIAPDLNLGKTAENICDRTGQEGRIHSGAHRLNHATAERVKARNHRGISAADATQALNRMTPANGVLHGQISRLLVSEARTSRTHHETSGRLDRRALTRMKTGASDVFSRRDYAPGIDTAVLILIDLSGSMGARIELARVAAWAMANAAESAGGKLAIAGFKGEEAHAILHYAKDWHQTANQCAGQLVSMVANAYTPLSASIVAGTQDIAAQPATRRIIIVLTDGQCDLGGDAVQSACRLAGAQGVEVVGIGISCAGVVKSFPPRYSVNVEDVNELAKTGLGALTRMLEETGAH